MLLARIVLVLISSYLGFLFAPQSNLPLEQPIKSFVIIGIVIAKILTSTFFPFISIGDAESGVYLLTYCFFIYLGVTIAYKKSENVDFMKFLPSFIHKSEDG